LIAELGRFFAALSSASCSFENASVLLSTSARTPLFLTSSTQPGSLSRNAWI
jgi:hypothetical protein